MADVRPFRGLRYDPGTVGDLGDMVCPPFDTISPQLQLSLYDRSPYNVVRLELGEALGSDTPGSNRYTRAAATLAQWMDDGILARDDGPAYYLLRHSFSHRGRDFARLELIACVRLEGYERGVVLPHERTRERDKQDRLDLMSACHANFSPVMCLYRDEERSLSRLLERSMSEPPQADFTDAAGQGYRAWRLLNGETVSQVAELFSRRALYIADGHHRYETALAYKDLAAPSTAGSSAQGRASDFIMMGLIAFQDPGLMVLPYHRVIGGLDTDKRALVRERLDELFQVEPLLGPTKATTERLCDEVEVRGAVTLAIGLLQDTPGQGPEMLVLRPEVDSESWGPLGRSEAWVLEEKVLKPALGDEASRLVDYVHEADEAERRITAGECQMAFLLKPFPLDLFRTLVDLGERLPPKSTFFYPKLPTGLVMNLLDGNL